MARRTGRSGSAGAAVIEFLLTLPFLFALVFGAVELSIALIEYNTVTKQAREAARFYANNVRDAATPAYLRSETAPLGGAFGSRSLETLVSNIAQCGRWEACNEGDLRRVYLRAQPARLPRPPPRPDPSRPPEIAYVTVEVEYDHPFALLQSVLGSGITLRATAVMSVP